MKSIEFLENMQQICRIRSGNLEEIKSKLDPLLDLKIFLDSIL